MFPDNYNNGTVDNLLLECGRIIYPELIENAEEFTKKVTIDKFDENDIKDFKKPAGRQKAIIGCAGSILRPGKAIQVSLQDNKWISEKAMGTHAIVLLNKFIRALIDLPVDCDS